MAKNATISDDEARAIAGSPKPTPAAMKKVLTWASAAASPDKIPALLGLQTDNHASRKDLDDAVLDALIACARSDSTPLWDAVQRDFDTYRVLHAIRALGKLGDRATTERLIQLGKTKILRTHWGAIEDAAKAAGIAIPSDVADEQKRLEALRGALDFRSEFEARKSAPATSPAPVPKKQKASGQSPPSTDLPPIFSADGEANAFLARHKTSLANRWSLGKMEKLFEAVDLAFFMTALGREVQALHVLDYLASNIKLSGNYNVWTPTGYGLALKARLHRLAGETKPARDALAELRIHPFEAPLGQQVVQKNVASIPTELRDAAGEKSAQTAARKLSRALCGAVFYRETAAGDFPHAGWYDADSLEATVVDGLRLLHDRLT